MGKESVSNFTGANQTTSTGNTVNGIATHRDTMGTAAHNLGRGLSKAISKGLSKVVQQVTGPTQAESAAQRGRSINKKALLGGLSIPKLKDPNVIAEFVNERLNVWLNNPNGTPETREEARKTCYDALVEKCGANESKFREIIAMVPELRNTHHEAEKAIYHKQLAKEQEEFLKRVQIFAKTLPKKFAKAKTFAEMADIISAFYGRVKDFHIFLKYPENGKILEEAIKHALQSLQLMQMQTPQTQDSLYDIIRYFESRLPYPDEYGHKYLATRYLLPAMINDIPMLRMRWGKKAVGQESVSEEVKAKVDGANYPEFIRDLLGRAHAIADLPVLTMGSKVFPVSQSVEFDPRELGAPIMRGVAKFEGYPVEESLFIAFCFVDENGDEFVETFSRRKKGEQFVWDVSVVAQKTRETRVIHHPDAKAILEGRDAGIKLCERFNEKTRRELAQQGFQFPVRRVETRPEFTPGAEDFAHLYSFAAEGDPMSSFALYERHSMLAVQYVNPQSNEYALAAQRYLEQALAQATEEERDSLTKRIITHNQAKTKKEHERVRQEIELFGQVLPAKFARVKTFLEMAAFIRDFYRKLENDQLFINYQNNDFIREAVLNALAKFPLMRGVSQLSPDEMYMAIRRYAPKLPDDRVIHNADRAKKAMGQREVTEDEDISSLMRVLETNPQASQKTLYKLFSDKGVFEAIYPNFMVEIFGGGFQGLQKIADLPVLDVGDTTNYMHRVEVDPRFMTAPIMRGVAKMPGNKEHENTPFIVFCFVNAEGHESTITLHPISNGQGFYRWVTTHVVSQDDELRATVFSDPGPNLQYDADVPRVKEILAGNDAVKLCTRPAAPKTQRDGFLKSYNDVYLIRAALTKINPHDVRLQNDWDKFDPYFFGLVDRMQKELRHAIGEMQKYIGLAERKESAQAMEFLAQEVLKRFEHLPSIENLAAQDITIHAKPKKGATKAALALSQAYYYGNGVECDPAKARLILRIALNQTTINGEKREINETLKRMQPGVIEAVTKPLSAVYNWAFSFWSAEPKTEKEVPMAEQLPEDRKRQEL